MGIYVLAYDIGTTGVKTCIYQIANQIQMIDAAMEGYGLKIGEHGEAEQDLEQIWTAMCNTTRSIMDKRVLLPSQIAGISFCSQMQGLVLVDKKGNLIRPSMSYMDQRAVGELQNSFHHGFKIAGMNARKLIKSIRITGAVAGSVKDPVWKYLWVKHHEPENYAQIHKWLDVKEFLILKCTDQFVMTHDSAFGTMLYDIREGKECFSKSICKMHGVKLEHMPTLVEGTSMVGPLTSKAATELHLNPGTPVFGGGGDASLIGVGAGAVMPGSTHIYSGTSGWVSTVVCKRVLDIRMMIASIVGVTNGRYHYFAELETASKCVEWVRDHLALDEINIYLQKVDVSESLESIYVNLYDFMLEEIKDVPAGSHGVIFTPWLHGNRCPFEDPNARGMFYNISLETGKRDLIHAVIEGICYHLRWQLEAQERKVKTSEVIRFVGGGALAPLTCQTIADILGRTIETVEHPQNVGAMGAAITAGVGLGVIPSIENAGRYIEANAFYQPNPANRQIHDRNYKVFQRLYENNRKSFQILNKEKNL